jgi:hypothetical protein
LIGTGLGFVFRDRPHSEARGPNPHQRPPKQRAYRETASRRTRRRKAMLPSQPRQPPNSTSLCAAIPAQWCRYCQGLRAAQTEAKILRPISSAPIAPMILSMVVISGTPKIFRRSQALPRGNLLGSIPALTVPRKNKIKTFFRLPLIVANELRLSALKAGKFGHARDGTERNGMHARELCHRADPPSA